MKKILILIVIVGVLYELGYLSGSSESTLETVVGYENKVVLYSTSWCGYCAKARELLKKNNVSYVEYDIEKSSKGKQEYDRINGNFVPVMVIDGNVIRGYDPKTIMEHVERL